MIDFTSKLLNNKVEKNKKIIICNHGYPAEREHIQGIGGYTRYRILFGADIAWGSLATGKQKSIIIMN